MAEKRKCTIDNIIKANDIIREGKLDRLIKENNDFESGIRNVKSSLEKKLKALAEQKKTETVETASDSFTDEKITQEKVSAVSEEKKETSEKVTETTPLNDKMKEAEKPISEEKPAVKDNVKPEKSESEMSDASKSVIKPVKEVKPEKVTKAEPEVKPVTEKKSESNVKEKSEKEIPSTQEKTEQVKPAIKESKPEREVPSQNDSKKKENENKPEKPAEFVPKPRPSWIVRREDPNKTADKRSERPNKGKEFRPDNRQNDRRPRGEGFNRGEGYNKGEGFNRPRDGQNNFNRGPKPDFNKGGNKKPQQMGTFVAPNIVTKEGEKRNFSNKKKQNNEKNYEEKRVVNKRALIRNQVDIDDFDENKSGYRKFRPVKKAKEKSEITAIKIEKAVINTEVIPLKVLSEKIGITAAEITKRLFKEGIMKTINDSIDFDTAAFIADDIGVELELKLDKTAEDVLSEGFDETVDDDASLKRRPPVVTVMGHVDHGKTSLLDRIRKSNVTAGEAGGITQHIGAYQVSVGGQTITFLDTPGHAAFTAMRARGAQATDIAVLVVAADDGIMPQTIEAINHAKAADVPIIVAINKIDKPEANVERIKTQLTEHGLLPEEWGGDTIVCPVSARTGEGFDNLLENINLIAEIKDLKANPDRKAKGVVIEAKLDQSKGPVATILVQNGTLHVSDSVIVGTVTGKIRAMSDDKGRRVRKAEPSTPVSVMGLDEVPEAGDILYAVEHEKLSKLVAEERKNKEKENMLKSSGAVTLDDVFNKIAEGAMKGLNLIVKADVQGSVEAVKQSMEKLSNEEVKVNVIHAAVGAIKESDIMLAESSNAIIIGFNVRPDSNAKQIAETSGVDIKLYRVIYEAIEDVERALKGMLAPKFTEVYMGKAEVREVFKISGVGQVAGCYVTEGKIIRSGKLRIYRDDVMITEGNVLQLKRFKDDVKEVQQGFECGISIEKFNDIKVGDFIESYQVEENKD